MQEQSQSQPIVRKFARELSPSEMEAVSGGDVVGTAEVTSLTSQPQLTLTIETTTETTTD